MVDEKNKEIKSDNIDKSKSYLKKELPKITKIQEEIIDFWNKRGYENITHVLGMSIHLHLKDRYIHNGLDLQYLEQFYHQAQIDLFKVMDEIIKEEKDRCGEANAVTCYAMLKEKIIDNKTQES